MSPADATNQPPCSEPTRLLLRAKSDSERTRVPACAFHAKQEQRTSKVRMTTLDILHGKQDACFLFGAHIPCKHWGSRV
jgi:hypothetical protein